MRRKRLCISSPEGSWGLNTTTLHTKRASQRGKLDGRVNKIHADEAIGAVEQLQPLLDDPIAAIVE